MCVYMYMIASPRHVCFRITCETPQASYHRLLLLGSEEPTCCSATDLLQKLLLSDQTPQ